MATNANAANQYWVGGTSGEWGGNNWASSAGGTGAAWTSGSRAYFTTSPSTIDLNGANFTIQDIFTSGFSSGKRCAINFTNSSSTKPTLTITDPNLTDASAEIGFANISFENLKIYNSNTNYGLELNNYACLRFGSGAVFTEAASKTTRLGYSLSSSNTIEVVDGAQVTFKGNVYVAVPSESSYAPTGVIRVSGEGSKLTANQIVTGFRTKGTKYAAGTGGKAAVIVENGATMKLNDVYLGKDYNDAGGNENGPVITMLVQSGGTLECGVVYCREYAHSGRTITINNGTMKATRIEPEWDDTNKYKAKNMTINVVTNGVLETTGHFYTVNYSSSCNENILFDGGTFRAAANLHTLSTSYFTDATTFTVGPLGMTVDTQSYTLDWNTKIDRGSGKITKKGSGTLNWGWSSLATGGMDVNAGTLSVSGSGTHFEGPLTVKSGATLKNAAANNPSYLAKAVTFEAGAKLAVPAADGVLSVIKAPAISIEGTTTVSFPNGFPGGRQTILTMTGSGSFTAEDAAKLTVPANAAGYVFYVSSDGKSIQIGPAAGRWTGAAGNLLIDDPGNWSDNAVPDGTPAFIAVDEATTLLCNGTFSPKSITFAADSKAITFNGEGSITGIEAITNLNASSTQTNHRFNIPVSGDTVDLNNRGDSCCIFSGGFTVANPVLSNSADIDNAHSLAGIWTITGASWSPGTYDTVRGDASITFEHELKDPGNFNIASGAVVTAATMKVTSSTYPAYSNSGRLVVNGICDVSNTSVDFSLAREESQNATVILGGLVFNTSRWAWLNAKTIVVGSEGIKFDNTNNNTLRFSGTPQLYARDGTLTLHAGKDDNQQYAINTDNTLTINTTQFESSPERPSIVYINGKIQYVSSANYNGGIAVKGIGKVVFDSVSTFSGGLTVGDTATVAINAGKQAGTGAITVNSGAALEIPQSGAATIPGAVTLKDNAVLSFNFTSIDSAPKFVFSNTATASGTVKVKVSAADGVFPRKLDRRWLIAEGVSGEFELDEETKPIWADGVSLDEDGNLYLDVKAPGLTLSVR